MDLCTVISEGFIDQAINLIYSYKYNSYNKNVYIYYFNIENNKLDRFEFLFGDQVKLIPVQKLCDHAYDPRVFFYKVYAINDCLVNQSASMIYSDAANCFIRPYNIMQDLIEDSLFMSYDHPMLTNEYWTTDRCFQTMNMTSAKTSSQYWAGFQVYKRTKQNLIFVNEMLECMIDPRIAKPDTTVQYPDGQDARCIEHRQDQSVLSLLIHKHHRQQEFDVEKNYRYGDWQTIINFDHDYSHDYEKMILSPRESKFGKLRFVENV